MKYIVDITRNILSVLFPHVEPTPYLAPFIQETWLEKNMHDLQLKDYLWIPPAE